MQNKSKKFIFAGCLAASVATTGLVGCHTEDRSAGTYMDDRRIARRVEGNLKDDPTYKYKDVHVNVFEGVAQLSGFVDTPAQVTCAANTAARTEGVREVINDVALKPQFKLVPQQQAQGAMGNNAGTQSGTVYRAPANPNAPIISGNPNAASQAGQLPYNREAQQYNEQQRNLQNQQYQQNQQNQNQ